MSNEAFEAFKNNVENWAKVRNIYSQSSEYNQVKKALEEIEEYRQAVKDKNLEEIKDAIGDISVCIVNASKFKGLSLLGGKVRALDMFDVEFYIKNGMYQGAIDGLNYIAMKDHGVSYEECINKAWNEIKDRKGIMRDGMYVKWDNMTEEEREGLINSMG